MPRLKPRFRKLLIRWVLYWIGVIILRSAMELPQNFSNWIVSRLALIGYYVFKSNRNIALSNLRLAFKELYSRKERRNLANKMFKNFGRSLAEFISLPMWSKKHIDNIVDGENYINLLRKSLNKGKGVIVGTGHIGNWELMAAYTAIHLPLYVIARRLYFKPFDKAVVNRRNKLGINVIYQQDGIKPIIKALRHKNVIGLLVDQDIKGVASDFVEFFGEKAKTPNAHAALSLTTDTDLFAAALVRKQDSKHFKILVEGPIQIKRTGDKTLDRINLVQKWSNIFEGFIRKHPEQWAWFHPRWKTRPDS